MSVICFSHIFLVIVKKGTGKILIRPLFRKLAPNLLAKSIDIFIHAITLSKAFTNFTLYVCSNSAFGIICLFSRYDLRHIRKGHNSMSHYNHFAFDQNNIPWYLATTGDGLGVSFSHFSKEATREQAME